MSVKYRRPNYRTDHDQIWHAYAVRPGDGSYQKQFDPPPKVACLVCLRRRTRSITNDRSPGWSVLRCCHGITQGQNLGPRGVEVGVLGGSKNQKSGKCHELSRKSIFVLTHVPGVLGVNISKVREISRTAEKIDKKITAEKIKKCNHYPTPSDGGRGGGLRATISK